MKRYHFSGEWGRRRRNDQKIHEDARILPTRSQTAQKAGPLGRGGHSERSRDNELKFPIGGKLCCVVLLSAFCALSAFCLSGEARAQSPELLNVERGPGAEECPDAPTLIARIAAIRGRAGAPGSASYDVGFSHTADTFTAVIRGGDGESQRVLEGRGLTCAALAQATAVTLALLFDSEVDHTPNEK